MARKDIGEMKRASGFQGEFWNRFVNEVIAQKGSAELLFGADEQTLDAAAQAAVAVLVGNTATDTGTVIARLDLTVNHGLTIEELRDAGAYNGYVNPNITSVNFPRKRGGVEKATLKLVKFSAVGTTAERERALLAHGDLIDTDMDDMLTTGIQHPNEQRKHPIVFLGASWVSPDGRRNVGCLFGGAESRSCYLDWTYPPHEWGSDYVFAVRARK